MTMPRAFCCPKCRSTESLVDDTGRDEEGYIIRNRRCVPCGTTWATEELPIAASFWSRANSRAVARRLQLQKAPRICTKCGGEYLYGHYNRHVRVSSRHEAAVKPPSNGSTRKHTLNYQRDWARKHRGSAA